MSEAGKLGAIASLRTHNKNKELRVEEYNRNPKVCLSCESSIGYESRINKFCSHSCAAFHSNAKRTLGRTASFEKRERVECLCLNCGNKTGRNAKKYCSRSCAVNHQWKLKKEQISATGKPTEVRQAKKYLKETRPNQCEMCGVDTWAGKPIMLVCDHINGNSEDWNLNNLRLICSNCDATTPFYKNRNKGNGRHKRRERYHSGKSY